MNILLGVTGSVAAIHTKRLAKTLSMAGHDVRVIMTTSAIQFVFGSSEPKPFIDGKMDYCIPVYYDWNDTWNRVGDEILHIELRKWADAFVIAPLTANTLAKLATGLCDNLLTNVFRAWDWGKPVFIAPAMNTYMWDNQPTQLQLAILQQRNCTVWSPVCKLLACGDEGMGAMAPHARISYPFHKWVFPLAKGTFTIPNEPYPGGFGFERKYDIHTGVDLYCEEGEHILACEDGEVIAVGQFTGERVGSPWWNDTWYVSVLGPSGVITYGELNRDVLDLPERIRDGEKFKAGEEIGRVARVLKWGKVRKDIPGHSHSMLHLELMSHDARTEEMCPTWHHGQPKPPKLLDPTEWIRLSDRRVR